MKKIIAYVSLALLPLTSVFAEGYQVNGQSAKQTGMGNAGVALKLGAESMHFNPAGLGFMDKTIDLSAGIAGVFPSAKLERDGVTYKNEKKASTPIYFYGAFKIYDFMKAGIMVNNPYGSAMNWGKTWPGAGLIQDINLKSFNIQPTVAFKIGDRLSLGVGAMIMFGNFELSRALFPAGMFESARPALADYPQLVAIIDNFKDIPAASATLKGDAGIKMGYNIGAMFDIIPNKLTIGASYRSKVMMKVDEGHATLDYANETALNQLLAVINAPRPIEEQIHVPPLDRGTFAAELPLPSNFTVGLAYKPIDKLNLTGEVQFVGWGAYKTLNVQFSQEVLEGYSISNRKEYENSRIYRIGGEYAATSRLDLRLGFYFDETPVKDDFLNPETPSMNKLGSCAGFSFRPIDRLSIDFAYAFITGFGRDGSYTDQLSGTFGGHYKVHAHNPTIGVAYSF